MGQPNLTPKKGALLYCVEHRPAIRPGMHDLSVQDGAAAGEFLADGLRQRLERLERIPVTGYQPAGAALRGAR